MKTHDSERMQRLIEAFWSEQESSWQLMAKSYANLAQIAKKEIPHDGKAFVAQYNPARITSSGAKVDKKSIEERPCFLCPHALKEGQKGLLLLGKYLLLINPFPILKEHFTIPHIAHTPQELSSQAIEEMAQLAALLSPKYDVYFNGASAGASAPDHFHFQAGPQGALPLCEAKVEKWLSTEGSMRLGIAESKPRTALVISASSIDDIVAGWERILPLINDPTQLNLIMRCTEEGAWHFWVILRSKHRPDCYFKEGAGQLLISPGVVDMGGIAVLSREQDYKRINGATWYAIMQEVSLKEEKFMKITKQLQS